MARQNLYLICNHLGTVRKGSGTNTQGRYVRVKHVIPTMFHLS